MWRERLTAILVVVAVWCSAACGQQTILFDNFGPNNTYANYGTWFGSGFGEVMYEASAFTPVATGRVTRIEAGMWTLLPASANQVTLHLLTQVGTVPPTASSIWSQTYNNALASSYGGVASFPVNNGPVLFPHTRYWLYVETPPTGAYDPADLWQTGLSGSAATASYFAQSPTRPNTWHIFDPPVSAGRSLRVISEVPEPTFVLLLPLSCCLRGHRRSSIT